MRNRSNKKSRVLVENYLYYTFCTQLSPNCRENYLTHSKIDSFKEFTKFGVKQKKKRQKKTLWLQSSKGRHIFKHIIYLIRQGIWNKCGGSMHGKCGMFQMPNPNQPSVSRDICYIIQCQKLNIIFLEIVKWEVTKKANVNIFLQIHEIDLNILKMLGRVYELFFWHLWNILTANSGSSSLTWVEQGKHWCTGPSGPRKNKRPQPYKK